MNELIWTPIKVRLGQIIKWEHNPRMSTKIQAQRLIKSERELGQIQTVAISPFDENGFCNLYDGHQRVSAWLTVKGADWEVNALQSNRHLTEDERKKVSVLLHTATGSWSWDALSSWSAVDLKEWGMDKTLLKDWRTDASALSNFLDSEDNPDENDVILDQAIQMKPPQEYLVVVCDSPEQWEELKTLFKLPFVRRGGYKKGSQFDDVGIQRVIKYENVLEVINAIR